MTHGAMSDSGHVGLRPCRTAARSGSGHVTLRPCRTTASHNRRRGGCARPSPIKLDELFTRGNYRLGRRVRASHVIWGRRCTGDGENRAWMDGCTGSNHYRARAIRPSIHHTTRESCALLWVLHGTAQIARRPRQPTQPGRAAVNQSIHMTHDNGRHSAAAH